MYATDASNFRQPPIGVVIPKTIDDVVATHRVCAAHDVPILNRGAGTSLSGETVNHAVVIDFSKYLHEVLEIDADRQVARVQPGTINDVVNEHAKAQGLVFGPDPSTHAYCTVGGNIGNNSCGTHSLHARFRGGGSRTSDNVRSLDVLTYDGLRMTVGPTSDAELDEIIAAGGRRGQIYADLRALRDQYADLIRKRFVDIPRRVSGYNIDELLPEKGFNVARALVGTEGTCVTVLGAELELVPNPAHRSLLVVGYEDIFTVARHLEEILEYEPMACEAIDHHLYRNEVALGMHPDEVSMLPDGEAWVLVEVGGDTKEEADAKAAEISDRLCRDDHPPSGTSLFDDPDQEARLWDVRESGLGATAFPPEQLLGPLAGLGGLRRRSFRRRSVPARPGPALRRVRLPRRPLRPPRRRLHPLPHRLRPPHTRAGSTTTATSWSGPPTSSCRTAARCRASTATGSNAGSCSPGCTATSSWRRSGRSSGSGTRGTG